MTTLALLARLVGLAVLLAPIGPALAEAVWRLAR